MSQPQLSAYVSAFNLIKNGFDYQTALKDMLAFFDEVVVAVNTSEDDTLDRLQLAAMLDPEKRLKVVSTSFAYTDITFDGAIKNAALQACTQEDTANRVYVQMDMDERVPLSQRDLWRTTAAALLANPSVQCLMIPSVDLYGSMETVQSDRPFGLKFRMHKAGLHRGVWKQAWRNGRTLIDTSRSDSCELLNDKDELAHAMSVVPHQFLAPGMSALLNQFPFTLHLGYVNFDQRIRVNKAIWKEHWELRSGHPENVAVDKSELDSVRLLKHSLKLT